MSCQLDEYNIPPLRKLYPSSKSTCTSLQSFIQKQPHHRLSYSHIQIFISDMIQQIRYIESQQLCIPFFSIDDILVLTFNENNDTFIHFLYTNQDKIITELSESNHHYELAIMIDKSEKFLPPELKEVNTLPKNIHRKSGYYSLGIMTCHLYKKSFEKMEYKQVYPLPFYWFVFYATTTDPHKRFLLEE